MRVVIIGPNLPDQSKGSFHVHAAGCADIRRSPQYRSREFDYDKTNPVSVADRDEIVEYAYADQIGGGEMTVADGRSDVYVFPCAAALK